MGFIELAEQLMTELSHMPEEQKINALNAIRLRLHEVSPFRAEPVDCVIWVPAEQVQANDDEEHVFEVVDGFHRNRAGKECADIKERVKGYLPVTVINKERQGRTDRIAATIRHNRARGKHAVTAMSDIVLELSRRNWSDKKIAKELGMEPDEVLRLKQITGLAELFADRDFSMAWEG